MSLVLNNITFINTALQNKSSLQVWMFVCCFNTALDMLVYSPILLHAHRKSDNVFEVSKIKWACVSERKLFLLISHFHAHTYVA